MMQWLVGKCLQWRLLVLVMVAIVGALGVRSALRLPIDAVPDITNVQVQVLTSAPALGPIDVERMVTMPVERAMSGLPGMTEVRSPQLRAFTQQVALHAARRAVLDARTAQLGE